MAQEDNAIELVTARDVIVIRGEHVMLDSPVAEAPDETG